MIVASGSDKDWLEEDWLTNLIYFGGNSDAKSLLSEIGQDNEETSLDGVQWYVHLCCNEMTRFQAQCEFSELRRLIIWPAISKSEKTIRYIKFDRCIAGQ